MAPKALNVSNPLRMLRVFSTALAPTTVLSDVPADCVTKDIIQRLFFAHFTPGALTDDAAKLALEINELGYFAKLSCHPDR